MILICAVSACDSTQPPRTGSLAVATLTEGEHLDPDGYLLAVGTGSERRVPANGTANYSQLTPGSYSLTLSDLAENCSPLSDNPQTVTVVADAEASASFSVSCERMTGALAVMTSTSGEDIDSDGYQISHGGGSNSLAVDDSILIASLDAGEHVLELQGIAENCVAVSENPQTATLEYRDTVTAAFSVECGNAELGGIRFDIAPDVPEAEVTVIKEGLGIAQDYLDEHLGGDILPEIKKTIRVKIVATGQGNPEEGAFGGGVTAFSSDPDGNSIIRPFFDVAHEHWASHPNFVSWPLEAEQRARVVHEYVHGWQHSLGCMTIYSQPLGNWINEGIANWLGFRAMIQQGAMDSQEVFDFMVHSAKVTGQLDVPLAELEPTTSRPWSGHVGYVAIDMLIERSGGDLAPLRVVCEEIAHGSPVDEAFEIAFGISKAAFYDEFEQWRQNQLGPVELNFDLAPDVPQSEVALIAEGLTNGQAFFSEHVGGDIPLHIRSNNVTVELVATGLGHPSGGACCSVSIAENGEPQIHIFFDVKHPHWDRESTVPGGEEAEKTKTSIHEYTHAWQHTVGCIDPRLYGAWFHEGTAEYLAFEALIRGGETTRQEVMNWAIEAARHSGSMDRPLEDMGGTGEYWPGDIGQIAIGQLVDRAAAGVLAVRSVCEGLGSGASREGAFEAAFGVSLYDFYAEFEEWREGQLASS